MRHVARHIPFPSSFHPRVVHAEPETRPGFSCRPGSKHRPSHPCGARAPHTLHTLSGPYARNSSHLQAKFSPGEPRYFSAVEVARSGCYEVSDSPPEALLASWVSLRTYLFRVLLRRNASQNHPTSCSSGRRFSGRCPHMRATGGIRKQLSGKRKSQGYNSVQNHCQRQSFPTWYDQLSILFSYIYEG